MVETGNHVNMHVGHFLRRSDSIGLADVYPISFRGPAYRLHHPCNRNEQSSNLVHWHFEHCRVVLLGHYQRMTWVEGIVVKESDRVLVLIHPDAFSFAFYDLAEDTVFQVELLLVKMSLRD